MHFLIVIALFLLNFSAFAAESKPKAWIYGGLDYGIGSQESDEFNEKDTTNGKYYGAQIMGQYRFEQVDFELGLGWLDYKVSTDFKTGVNSRVRLHTKAPYAHAGVFYKLTERFSLGLVSNYILDGGLLISDKDKSSLFAGIAAYYNVPLSEKMAFRVGAVAQKSLDFINRDVTLVGLNVQVGFAVSPSEQPVLKKNQTQKSQGIIQTKKVITLVTLDETLINFDTDQYSLDDKSKALIADLGAFLISNPELWEELEIEGHTDIVGSDYYNNVLSVRRANSVYEAVTSLAIDKKRVFFSGSGKHIPLDPSISVEAFAKNRRVDLKFVNVSDKNHFNEFIDKLKTKYRRNK